MFSNFKYTIFFFFTIFATGFTISQPLRLPPLNPLNEKREAPEIRNNRTFQPTQRQEEIEEDLFPQNSFLETDNPHWLSFLETDNPHWNSLLATEAWTVPIVAAIGGVCMAGAQPSDEGLGANISAKAGNFLFGALLGLRPGAVVGVPIWVFMESGSIIGREIGKIANTDYSVKVGEKVGRYVGGAIALGITIKIGSTIK